MASKGKGSQYIITILILACLTGCWNYREIENLGIVAGVAVDKCEQSDEYEMTVEVIESKGEEAKVSSKIITVKGKTIFDAARNAISTSGKRLYWSHAKLLILSQEIAREGATTVIDWYNRDSETRASVSIAVAKTPRARDIFEGEPVTEQIISFEIRDMISNQKSLGKAPDAELWSFINELETQGIMVSTPVIDMIEVRGKKIESVSGTALFKKGKLVGFLDGEDTRYLLFAKNKIDGGILVEEINAADHNIKVTLEIFENKTKIKPVISNGEVIMNISIETTVSIDEISGEKNIIEEENIEVLEKELEKTLKQRIERVIAMIQQEYNSDVLGFGSRLREEMPSEWAKRKNSWDELFPEIPVEVSSKIKIKNSAMAARTIELGD